MQIDARQMCPPTQICSTESLPQALKLFSDEIKFQRFSRRVIQLEDFNRRFLGCLKQTNRKYKTRPIQRVVRFYLCSIEVDQSRQRAHCVQWVEQCRFLSRSGLIIINFDAPTSCRPATGYSLLPVRSVWTLPVLGSGEQESNIAVNLG